MIDDNTTTAHPAGDPGVDSSIERLIDEWPGWSEAERFAVFTNLPRVEAEELFLSLPPAMQCELVRDFTPREQRSWVRLLAPDDVADLIQEFPYEARSSLVELLDAQTRREVVALLAYAEDEAGGLMNPRFIRLRPDVPVDVAIRYIRQQARNKVELIQYAYVMDSEQRLVGVVSFRDLLVAPPESEVREVMETEVVSVPEEMDQEEVGRRLAQHDLVAIPVVDDDGRMKGIVTVDDVVDVVEEEATEDIQKIGGTEALDEPYFQISLGKLIRKRAGWLTVLFVGEMLTATAMGYYEREIERAVVLALFIPLIISSGGNSGSQASTLVIRAMALGEVQIRDWRRVFGREMISGLALGAILGAIGMARVAFVPGSDAAFGEHYMLIGVTVACTLVAIVLWGTIAGSMLPFLLRRCGFDPASASAPFVATIVDVTGVIIYFTAASIILAGTLL